MEWIENNKWFDIIDNEKINNSLELLENKTDISTQNYEKALKLLNKIDKSDRTDIDLVYDKNKKLYYLVLWNSDVIKNWDLSNDTIDLVKYLPSEWVDINWLEDIVNMQLDT